MERGYIIALDTHGAFTEVGVVAPGGRLRARGRLATTIPTLVEEIRKVPRPRAAVFEEGPLADWIAPGHDASAPDPHRPARTADRAISGPAGDQVDSSLDLLRLRGHAVAVPQQAGLVEISGHRLGAASPRLATRQLPAGRSGCRFRGK